MGDGGRLAQSRMVSLDSVVCCHSAIVYCTWRHFAIVCCTSCNSHDHRTVRACTLMGEVWGGVAGGVEALGIVFVNEQYTIALQFVTTDLYAKYIRNRIGNEYRVCNH